MTEDSINEANRQKVMEMTWGHLKPSVGNHPGEIVFAQGESGERPVLHSHFKDVPSSPWFFHDMNDFIWRQKTEPGTIYVFKGHYVTGKKRSKFVGETRKLDIKKYVEGLWLSASPL